MAAGDGDNRPGAGFGQQAGMPHLKVYRLSCAAPSRADYGCMSSGIWTLLRTVAVSAAAMAIVGCSDSSSPSNTSGVTTETFSGAVASLGVDTSHTFVITKSGTFNVKITLTQA